MAMKKIMNNPDTLVHENLQGFVLAYPNCVLVEDTNIVLRKEPKEKGKVKLMIGNGGGHEPCVNGWVGKGMLDMDVVGDLFMAPSYEDMLVGIDKINDGGPILMFVMNHAGDVLNSGLCYDEAKAKGIDIHSVLWYDDIASAPPEEEEERRGMQGFIYYMKICGAMAEEGRNVQDIIKMFEDIRSQTRTISVAVTPATHPQSGQPLFELPDDEIEIGMGVHGEAGSGRMKLSDAKTVAQKMVDIILEDRAIASGKDVLVCLANSGATTTMELNIVYKEIHAYLKSKGINAVKGNIGHYLTTQESAGFGLSILELSGDMLKYFNAPTEAPYFY